LVISFIYKKVPFLLLRVLVLYAKLVLAMGGILNEIISFASLIATGTARGGGCGLIYQTVLWGKKNRGQHKVAADRFA